MPTSATESAYRFAKEHYAAWGVDVDAAMKLLTTVPISMHCWQGDDIGGFENTGDALGGGLAVTGNYPGKARTGDELRADLDRAYSLIPGKHRLNLHALYAETGAKRVERDQLEPEHFSRWIDWSKSTGVKLDFNPSCFSHPLASDGYTLTNRDSGRRAFWIRHTRACRKIGEAMGRAQGSACVTNVWIPDGSKDTPADRKGPRELLARSLDEVFAEPIDTKHNLDAVEGKLFGLGSESYVVGSHEFYYGYCLKKGKLLTLDAGHYHPTETISDKISSVMCHLPEILLHVSRGVRWDSDHVVTLTDDLQAIGREIAVNGYLSRVHIGLDYFDASINRVAAWVIGTRAMLKSLLVAMLEPTEKLRSVEAAGDYTARLALQEEIKSLPFGLVWDHYCESQNVPVGSAWLDNVRAYEQDVQLKRK